MKPNALRIERLLAKVETSCVFRASMRHEVTQHDFKMFEGDS